MLSIVGMAWSFLCREADTGCGALGALLRTFHLAHGRHHTPAKGAPPLILISVVVRLCWRALFGARLTPISPDSPLPL